MNSLNAILLTVVIRSRLIDLTTQGSMEDHQALSPMRIGGFGILTWIREARRIEAAKEQVQRQEAGWNRNVFKGMKVLRGLVTLILHVT